MTEKVSVCSCSAPLICGVRNARACGQNDQAKCDASNPFYFKLNLLSPIAALLSVTMMASFGHGQEIGRIIEHRIPSPYQADETTLRILLPDQMVEGRHYRTLYVLPVRAESDERHGQGMIEIRDLDIPNRYDVICIAPAFTNMPWYNDHASDLRRQDESHLLKTVLPFVEANYPVRTDAGGRLLLGFSKSGWGAASLLLRHPKVFGKAAAWDTGIRVDLGPMQAADRAERIIQFWGTAENFARYRLSNLVKSHGDGLGESARLFYYNPAGGRAAGGVKLHELMVAENLPHRYVFEPPRRHSWTSGWIPEAVEFLLQDE
jgi:hypothetical protein